VRIVNAQMRSGRRSARAKGRKGKWPERSHPRGAHREGDGRAQLMAIPSRVWTGNDDHTKTHPQKILSPGVLAITQGHMRPDDGQRDDRRPAFQPLEGSGSVPKVNCRGGSLC
jgi:hypothetical protein